MKKGCSVRDRPGGERGLIVGVESVVMEEELDEEFEELVEEAQEGIRRKVGREG